MHILTLLHTPVTIPTLYTYTLPLLPELSLDSSVAREVRSQMSYTEEVDGKYEEGKMAVLLGG